MLALRFSLSRVRESVRPALRARASLVVAALVVCAPSLSGCGGDASSAARSDGGSEASPAAAIAAMCNGLLAIDNQWCPYRDRCCTSGDLSDPHFLALGCSLTSADRDQCVQSMTAEATAGHVVVNGDAVQSCVDALGATFPKPPETCSGPLGPMGGALAYSARTKDPEQLPECRDALQGQQPAGAACEYEYDCAQGLRCRMQDAMHFACGPVAMAGDGCELDEECADGLVCVHPPPSLTGTCAPPGSVGAACSRTLDCASGLDCYANQCVRPVVAGESCSSPTAECVPEAACTGPSYTCAPLLGDGMACTTSYECKGRCSAVDGGTGQCVDICGGSI